MRKTSLLTSVLLAIILIGGMANLLVTFRYLQVLRSAERAQLQARRLEAQVNLINRNLAVARNMAGEALDFSRKNPGMETLLKSHTPLLQRLGLVETPGTPKKP
jgi:hypothetical protein